MSISREEIKRKFKDEYLSKIEGPFFKQKRINHIFHYSNKFEVILKILNNGFAPSYCEENFLGQEFYIPMVSFCNIPLRDVDLFMRYGKHGIGMSLEWALKNSITPVVYVHDNTPFERQTYYQNEIETPMISYFKNWKTTYKKKEIITYQEREWRYIPNISDSKHKRIISRSDVEFQSLKDKSYGEKPHLPQFALTIDDISDLRYIMIKKEHQRNKVLNVLNKRFGEREVIKAILSGKLLIISDDLIHNDF
ncbi:abortive infection system antitoxin AbiGi family protein [Sediminitomix flava]|uniref:Abortive phage resistance protein AbiGi (Putative antitoxin) n=1 Tax=Sediminitomix flava TaxID=379075 RepID=A0A315YUQ3_SEDFL|nr:abortive infection system antitoxin AbiGi family protein [Sediminitomix flava]PWJ33125.1 abortive phage resistance protein AbiGi (putative antitoxin) [Sediminitomix flava]